MDRWENFKIFLKYIFSPLGLLEGARYELQKLTEPKRLSVVVLLFAVFLLIKLPYPKNQKVFALLLLIALAVHLIPVYRGGEHRAWYKKKMGVQNIKEIKAKAVEKMDKYSDSIGDFNE